MTAREPLTLLIVDDQDEILEIYQSILARDLGHRVECVAMPAEAMRHLRDTLYDVVVIDAKMSYKGAPLGGLLLAEEVGAVLGISSVILVSQYDVREAVRHSNPSYAFLSKPRSGGDVLAWVKRDLLGKIHALLDKQYGFVAMPLGNSNSEDWYRERLVPCMQQAGFRIMGLEYASGGIATNLDHLDRLRRIEEAHFIIVQLADQNFDPRVYFEAGYAVAHRKLVFVLGQQPNELDHALRSRYVIEVPAMDEETLREQLKRCLNAARGVH